MIACRSLARGLVVAVAALTLSAAAADEKKAEDRTGSVTGRVTAKADHVKGGNWIEVQADGEEKARKYYTGSNTVALKAVRETEIGSRVRLDWRFEEVFRVVKIEILKKPGPGDGPKK
jgi:hypothetical protein